MNRDKLKQKGTSWDHLTKCWVTGDGELQTNNLGKSVNRDLLGLVYLFVLEVGVSCSPG